MSVRDTRREAALERMADHLLLEGLSGASLRPLAAAAGTSDRMLLYYFKDKDEMLTATLGRVMARLAGLLDETAAGPKPFAMLLAELWAAFRSPALQPYMRLWIELAASAARNEAPHRTIAGQIADGFHAWAAGRLLVEREADRLPLAALLLATVDGLALLDAVGRGGMADSAAAALAARPAPGAKAPLRGRRG